MNGRIFSQNHRKRVKTHHHIFDINQSSLRTPFYSVLVSVSVFMALSTVFHSIKFSRELSAFSLCCFGLVSALLVL